MFALFTAIFLPPARGHDREQELVFDQVVAGN